MRSMQSDKHMGIEINHLTQTNNQMTKCTDRPVKEEASVLKESC